jgi:hypothetical protein
MTQRVKFTPVTKGDIEHRVEKTAIVTVGHIVVLVPMTTGREGRNDSQEKLLVSGRRARDLPAENVLVGRRSLTRTDRLDHLSSRDEAFSHSFHPVLNHFLKNLSR